MLPSKHSYAITKFMVLTTIKRSPANEADNIFECKKNLASKPNRRKLARYEECEEIIVGLGANLAKMEKNVMLYQNPLVGRIFSFKPLLLAATGRGRKED